MKGNLDRLGESYVYQEPIVASSRLSHPRFVSPFEVPVTRDAGLGLKFRREVPPVKALPMKKERPFSPRLAAEQAGYEGDIYEKGELLKRLGLIGKHALLQRTGSGICIVGGTVLVVGAAMASAPVAIAGGAILGTGFLFKTAAKRFWAKNKGAQEFAARFAGK